MLFVAYFTLSLSTGFGLSPGSCLLPHIGGGPDVPEHDEMMGPRHRGNPCAAVLQAPVQQAQSRRSVIAAATAASTAAIAGGSRPANAAAGPAVNLVEMIGDLSTQARLLQFFLREAAPSSSNVEKLRLRVNTERAQLGNLGTYMAEAAPNLRICAPGKEDCDCSPDPALMSAAAAQADIVRRELVALDDALAAGRSGFELIEQGALRYPGGRVERALEEICEAADTFLDLAAGRPLMTARVAPITSASTLPAVQPLARAATSVTRMRAPQLCATAERLFPDGVELNLIYDSKCGVCQWEVDFLSARDSAGRLMYTDLEADDFEENAPRNGNLDYETALASFHAVTSNGEVLSGMPVFKAAYDAVGLGWVWSIYDNKLAAAFFDLGYSIFARFRTDITRGTSIEALVTARRAQRQAQRGSASPEACGPCQEILLP